MTAPEFRMFVRDDITSGGGTGGTPPPSGTVLTKAQRDAIDLSTNTVKNQGSTVAQMQDFMRTFTGLLPGITLTQQASGISTTSSGQIIENLEILGGISVGHANVIIRNCWIRGSSTHAGAFISNTNSTRNLLVEDCLIGPPRDPLSFSMDGIRTCGFTARRCHLQGSTDGLGVFSDSTGNLTVMIEGCWVENMTKVCPDNGHTDGTHNDGIQWQG